MECNDDTVFNPLSQRFVGKGTRVGKVISAVLATKLDLYQGCEEGYIFNPSLIKGKCVAINDPNGVGKLIKAVYDNKIEEQSQIPIIQMGSQNGITSPRRIISVPCKNSCKTEPYGIKPGYGLNKETGRTVKIGSRKGKELFGDYNCMKYPKRPPNFKFNPLPHQVSLANYVEENIENINGVLLNWSLGSGKTCGAITIIDKLLDNYTYDKVFVLTSGSLRENFLDQYCNVCGVDVKRIRKSFRFITYNYNDVLSRFPKSSEFNNSIIIIDEVQSFTSPIVHGSDIYTSMYQIMKAASNTFFILMSGTPVTISIDQLFYVIDLCTINYENSYKEYRENFSIVDGVFIPNVSIIADMSHVISHVDKDSLKQEGKTNLINNITTLSNFYQQRMVSSSISSPEFSSPESLKSPFKEALFEESIDDEQLNDLTVPLPLSKDPVVELEILKLKLENIGLSEDEYKNIEQLSLIESANAEENPYPEVYEYNLLATLNEEQYSQYLNARELELMARPPDEDLKYTNPQKYKLEKSQYYLAISMLRSRKLCNMMYPAGFNKNDERIDSLEIDGGWITDEFLDNIGSYSSKFWILLQHLQNTKGKIVVYSEFKKRSGIWFLAAMLKYYNFNYLIFTGDLDDDSRGIIINKFNDPTNVNGDNYRVLLMTEAASQGQNFLAVRYLYIMEQAINEFDILQVKGRVVRYKSHFFLPPDERSVAIYRFFAITPGPEIAIEDVEWDRQTSDFFAYFRGQDRMRLVSGLNDALNNLPIVPN